MIREQRQMIIEDRLSEQISYVHSSLPRMLYAPVGSAPVPVSTFILEPTSTISVTVADTPPILEDTLDKMIVDV